MCLIDSSADEIVETVHVDLSRPFQHGLVSIFPRKVLHGYGPYKNIKYEGATLIIWADDSLIDQYEEHDFYDFKVADEHHVVGIVPLLGSHLHNFQRFRVASAVARDNEENADLELAISTQVHRLNDNYAEGMPFLKRYLILKFKSNVKASVIQPDEELRHREDLPMDKFLIKGYKGSSSSGEKSLDRLVLTFNVAFPNPEKDRRLGKLPKKKASKGAQASLKVAPDSPES